MWLNVFIIFVDFEETNSYSFFIGLFWICFISVFGVRTLIFGFMLLFAFVFVLGLVLSFMLLICFFICLMGYNGFIFFSGFEKILGFLLDIFELF